MRPPNPTNLREAANLLRQEIGGEEAYDLADDCDRAAAYIETHTHH